MSDKVNLKSKLASFNTHCDPKIVGELNGQHVKLVKFQGDFVWHSHEDEDEMFLVVSGCFDMLFRDRSVTVDEGEFVIVPRGVEHCPSAQREVHGGVPHEGCHVRLLQTPRKSRRARPLAIVGGAETSV